MQQNLYYLGFEYDVADKIFKYKAPDDIAKNQEIKQKWKGDKNATRTVFSARYWSKGDLYYCTHLAYSIEVKDFDDDWFICITPTWSVTINGHKKSRIGYKKVIQKKKMERNQAVYNHLRFLKYKLTYRDLFTIDYPFITFHALQQFTTQQVIDEEDWLNNELLDFENNLQDIEAPQDIKNED
jgi:hypothetical protein